MADVLFSDGYYIIVIILANYMQCLPSRLIGTKP
jgi:hypothetical protein